MSSRLNRDVEGRSTPREGELDRKALGNTGGGVDRGVGGLAEDANSSEGSEEDSRELHFWFEAGVRGGDERR